MSSQATDQLVLQRIRNKVIELLEAYSDNSQPELAQSLLEHWGDWVESEVPAHFISPVFTSDEKDAITQTHRAWKTVQYSTSLSSLEWVAFTEQSHASLNVMLKRGKQSENYEERF